MTASARAATPATALAAGLAELRLPAELAAPLLHYLDELQRWNRAYNLTAVRDPLEMVSRHLLDALALVPVLAGPLSSPGRCLLDVGSGAGLPAVPLALAFPGLAVTALDANGKKARFLRHVQRQLGLARLSVAEARVEHWQPPQRFDFITSRAFASLADFTQLSRPLLAPGGQWLAMKGKLSPAERQALPAGIELVSCRTLHVPGLDETRQLVVLSEAPSNPNP